MDETLTQPLVAVKSFGRLNAKEIIESKYLIDIMLSVRLLND